MRLHRNLVFTTIDSLMAIFNEGEYADKVVARALKKDKRWGSHDRKFVAETIYEIVNHQDLSLFFSNEHKILNEKTIIQKEGNLVIPDRMVLTKLNEIYLLDYKTGTHQTKYQLQLENYQKAIEKMGFKVTKKALVYIGDTLEIVDLQ